MSQSYVYEQLPLLLPEREAISQEERHGVVYTKPWVVEAILDLAGYTLKTNLVDTLTVEPAAGDGAFVLPIVARLIASCRQQNRPYADCNSSLLTYELDEMSAAKMKRILLELLISLNVPHTDASKLVEGWVRVGDYLLDRPQLPQADFVLGNPPYIRLEELNEVTAKKYRALYRTMIGRADIYIAFFEAALHQLKAGGVCAFICADRWMLNQYGAELRNLITLGFSVETIIEMHQAGAFENDVDAYPAITVIRRTKQSGLVVARAEQEVENASKVSIAQAIEHVRETGNAKTLLPGLRAGKIKSWFRGTEPWPRISPEQLEVLRYLESEFFPLESEGTGTKVSIGVATGADEIFITRDPSLVEEARLLPLAMAADTIDGHLQWSGHYLINPWNDQGLVNLEKYPRLRVYLEEHKKRLLDRHIGKKNAQAWYRTIDRVNGPLIKQPKLYIPDIKNFLNPVLDRGETYPHHNLYVVYSSQWYIEVLGGLLLTDLAQFFVECYGVRMRGGYLRFQAQYLRRIRVPRPQDISTADAALLSDAFRRHDRSQATAVALKIYKLSNLPLKENYD